MQLLLPYVLNCSTRREHEFKQISIYLLPLIVSFRVWGYYFCIVLSYCGADQTVNVYDCIFLLFFI